MEREVKGFNFEKPATPELLARPISISKKDGRPISFREYIQAKCSDLAITLALVPQASEEPIRNFDKLTKKEKLKLSYLIYKSGHHLYGSIFILKRLWKMSQLPEEGFLKVVSNDAVLKDNLIYMGKRAVDDLLLLTKEKRLRRPKEEELLKYSFFAPDD